MRARGMRGGAHGRFLRPGGGRGAGEAAAPAPGRHAALDARTGERALRRIVAEGLQEVCFRDGRRRADESEVAFTVTDYLFLGP